MPVSLIGTFAVFPMLGFSINTISLFGLILAIGLVVDDAIVVVEAVEHHIEHGLSPKAATEKAMDEVSGPVIGIALILSAVFVPMAASWAESGISEPAVRSHHRDFRFTLRFQCLDAFPGSFRLLLRPRKKAKGPLGQFFGWFNRSFDKVNRRLRNL